MLHKNEAACAQVWSLTNDTSFRVRSVYKNKYSLLAPMHYASFVKKVLKCSCFYHVEDIEIYYRKKPLMLLSVD